MSILSNLKSADLKRLSRLLAQKEILVKKLQAINATLDQLDGEARAGSPSGGRGRGSRKGTRRGQLKESILAALKAAGARGHTLAELATKLHAKPNNLYAWFYTTGKKVAGLKKSKDGRYHL